MLEGPGVNRGLYLAQNTVQRNSLQADGTLKCGRCGTVYTTDQFLAAHPGPGAAQALASALRSKMLGCAACHPVKPIAPMHRRPI